MKSIHETLVITTESPSPNWPVESLRKALAAFPEQGLPMRHGRRRSNKGSKYATLTDILRVCSAGETRSFPFRTGCLIGETLNVWRDAH